jgi:hypothetical protein
MHTYRRTWRREGLPDKGEGDEAQIHHRHAKEGKDWGRIEHHQRRQAPVV